MSFAKEVWSTLSKIDVNTHTEKKGKFTYLSWTWAWATLQENYPLSTYQFDSPVVYENGTCDIWCHLTISDGEHSITRSMWLAVLDYSNKAIVNPDAAQIGKTRMRCLVKAIAMFGLGHYIYAGESTPSLDDDQSGKPNIEREDDYGRQILTKEQIAMALDLLRPYVDGLHEGFEKEDYSKIIELWRELDQKQQQIIWQHATNTKQKDLIRTASKIAQ